MSAKRAQATVSLSPIDNRALANLCGALDANLRQIEAAYEVVIARRGATFTLRGAAAQAEQATAALQHFYERANEPLTVDDIQLGLIELGTQRGASAATPGPDGETEMPSLRTRRADLHGRTPNQIAYLRHIQEHDITFGIGPAGTGKTYLAVACAVDALERNAVQRIVLTRPAVEAGEKLGFLPGDLQEKVDPYCSPLDDALYDLMGFDKTAAVVRAQYDRIAPLGVHARQNAEPLVHHPRRGAEPTPEQMKMFLTRIGFGTKAVITGDVTQIDLARGQKSGLIEARRVLADVRGLAFTDFTSADVVRHPLVQKIISAYERHTRSERIDAPDSERQGGR
jgi:phosphate starvation-inducible PhoH-like protein